MPYAANTVVMIYPDFPPWFSVDKHIFGFLVLQYIKQITVMVEIKPMANTILNTAA